MFENLDNSALRRKVACSLTGFPLAFLGLLLLLSVVVAILTLSQEVWQGLGYVLLAAGIPYAAIQSILYLTSLPERLEQREAKKQEKAKNQAQAAAALVEKQAIKQSKDERKSQILAFYHTHIPYSLQRAIQARCKRVMLSTRIVVNVLYHLAAESLAEMWDDLLYSLQYRPQLVVVTVLLLANWVAMIYVLGTQGATYTGEPLPWWAILVGVFACSQVPWLMICTGWNWLDKRPFPSKRQRKLAVLGVSFIPAWSIILSIYLGNHSALWSLVAIPLAFGLAAGILAFYYECDDEPLIAKVSKLIPRQFKLS